MRSCYLSISFQYSISVSLVRCSYVPAVWHRSYLRSVIQPVPCCAQRYFTLTHPVCRLVQVCCPHLVHSTLVQAVSTVVRVNVKDTRNTELTSVSACFMALITSIPNTFSLQICLWLLLKLWRGFQVLSAERRRKETRNFDLE